MAIGRLIRGLFGPFEHKISELYRAIYLDIDAYVASVQGKVPAARFILEVGCGEGAICERLARAYPDAEITGIDIAANVGRLYAGPPNKVRFLQAPVQDIAREEPGSFDLIIMSDVLHHVPVAMRRELLETIRSLLAPQGVFAFKDWERTFTPIHWLCYFSDRWITGDRISYMRRAELRDRVRQVFGDNSIATEERVAPWRNNISLLVRP